MTSFDVIDFTSAVTSTSSQHEVIRVLLGVVLGDPNLLVTKPFPSRGNGLIPGTGDSLHCGDSPWIIRSIIRCSGFSPGDCGRPGKGFFLPFVFTISIDPIDLGIVSSSEGSKKCKGWYLGG